MDFPGAITAIRTATRYDLVSPSPVTDAQVTVWLNSELQRFRRQLNAEVPQIYQVTDSPQTIVAGAQTLTKPGLFDALVRIERQYGTRWLNIEPANQVDLEVGALGFEEVGSTFLIWPSGEAPATYRIIYCQAPTDGVLTVPPGMEDVPVERVCARVKERLFPAEAALHLQIADRIWAEQLPLLRRRFGRNNQAGFQASYRNSGGYRQTR